MAKEAQKYVELIDELIKDGILPEYYAVEYNPPHLKKNQESGRNPKSQEEWQRIINETIRKKNEKPNFPPPEMPKDTEELPQFRLKLKELENCYESKLNENYHRRTKRFYDRWQNYIENLPRRFPNFDYGNFSRLNYFDNDICDDFAGYSKSYKKKLRAMNVKGKCFQEMVFPEVPIESPPKDFQLVVPEKKEVFVDEPMYTCCNRYPIYEPSKTTAEHLDDKRRLYFDDPPSIWRERALNYPYQSTGCIYGLTPFKRRCHPFHKDTMFTSQRFSHLSTGNRPPFKEIGDLKHL